MARGTRSDAEAKYAKARAKAHEAAQVMSEVEAEAKRVTDNTARLKALRLARDAREAEETAAAAEARAAAKTAKKPRAKAKP